MVSLGIKKENMHIDLQHISGYGERWVPGEGSSESAYEHLHRYYIAREHAIGKRVLDVASGAGYGSDLLAEVALEVVGLDCSEIAVQYASETYVRPNLSFLRGDAEKLPFGAGSFDLVTSFETLEHLSSEDQESFLNDVMRVLSADGLFLMSTPNRPTYNCNNRFHICELDLDELYKMLSTRFPFVKISGQSTLAVSAVFSFGIPSEHIKEWVIYRPGGEYLPTTAGGKPARFFLAAASRVPLPPHIPEDSYLIDASSSLLREGEEALQWGDKLRNLVRPLFDMVSKFM